LSEQETDTTGAEQPQKKLKPEEIKVYVTDGFMVLFTALAMILLAFFIMLNALAVPNESKSRAAIGSLLGSFGVLPEGMGLDEEGAYVASVDHISMGDEVILFAAFEAFLDDENWDTDSVMVYTDDDGRKRIRFGEQFLFESGSVRFHPRVFPVLDRLAAMLKALKRPVEIEGHTDLAKGRTSNWKLSARRAVSVVRYLEEASHMHPAALSAAGFGDTVPVRPGESHPINRRVEVVVN
jgi:chemotaxis protein MotB